MLSCNVFKAKLIGKFTNSIDLFSNRINKQTVAARCNGKFYSRETGTGTHIKKVSMRRLGKIWKEEQRIEQMQNKGIVRIQNSSKVQDFILLDNLK